MSDQTPSPRAPESETIVKLFDHEYVRLKIDEEVRQRTQAELSAWWKRLVSIAAVIVTLIGLVGVKEYISLSQLREDAKNMTQKELAAFKAQADEERKNYDEERKNYKEVRDEDRNKSDIKAGQMEKLFKDAGLELSRMQGTAAAIREGNATNDARVAQLLGNASNSLVESAKLSGRLQEQVAVKENGLMLKEKDVEAMRDHLDGEVKEVGILRATLDKEEASRAKAFEAQVGTIKSIQAGVQEVRDRLYGGGSFVINEKSPTVIETHPGIAEGRFTIRVKRVSSREVKGVTIQDWQGKKLTSEPTDLLVNGSLMFKSHGYNYTLTLRYITELAFNSDQAGIDLLWEKEAPEKSAQAGQ